MIPHKESLGSSMYLANATWPDIACAVNYLTRKQLNPTEEDWNVVKKIFQYLKGISDLGIKYVTRLVSDPCCVQRESPRQVSVIIYIYIYENWILSCIILVWFKQATHINGYCSVNTKSWQSRESMVSVREVLHGATRAVKRGKSEVLCRRPAICFFSRGRPEIKNLSPAVNIFYENFLNFYTALEFSFFDGNW